MSPVGHDARVPQASQDPTTSADVPRHVRLGNRLLEVAETVVYVGIAALLVAIAVVVIGRTAADLPALFTGGFDGTQSTALELLDSLLLVFIVVELLYAVRMTIAKRQLVAEPFLLVGVIASIKEIVVVSVKAADLIGEPEFADAAWQIGVLGGLVLALGVTAWLLRLKEREPDETEGDDPDHPERARASVPA